MEQFPPNPNEFESTWFSFFSNNSVSGIIVVSGIGVEKFKLGNTKLFCNANTEYTASIAAAAAKVCPVKAFVELMPVSYTHLRAHET